MRYRRLLIGPCVPDPAPELSDVAHLRMAVEPEPEPPYPVRDELAHVWEPHLNDAIRFNDEVWIVTAVHGPTEFEARKQVGWGDE